MIGPTILEFADLQRLCQPGQKPRLATVEKWAREIGLKFTYDGHGGLISTVDAVNAAIGVGSASNDGKYSPEQEV